MKYKWVFLAVFLFSIVFFFVGKYAFQHHIGYGAVAYVNDAIPTGFQFTDEHKEIPDDLRVNSKYKTITQNGGMFSEDFTCQETHAPAQIMRYFQKNPGYGYAGGWSYRYAVICGDQYLVVYGADYIGEVLYGPFTLPQQTN